MSSQEPQHITADQVDNATKSANPSAPGLNITVSVPETVEIKLVNANALTDFEIWIYISSLLSNVVVGFWIACVQNSETKLDSYLRWTSIVFTILFIVAIIVAIMKRRQLSNKSKSYKIRQGV